MRNLSIRWRLQFALFAIILASAIMATWTHYSADKSLYLLLRAQQSSQQLELLEGVSADVNRYLLFRVLGYSEAKGMGEETQAAMDGIQRRVKLLEIVTQKEIDFVETKEEKAEEEYEETRLKKIEISLNAIDISLKTAKTDLQFAQSVLPIYQQSFQPLIQEAIEDEREEVQEVVDQMQKTRDQLSLSGLLVLFFQMLAIALVIYVLLALIIRPLSALKSHIQMVGKGALDHRISTQRHDEFGLIYAHFNRMASHLELSRRKLHSSNEVLETTVEERTASLQDTNRRLNDINDSRKRFFADVSHELRTPLTTIIGEAEVTLRAQNLPENEYNASMEAVLVNANFMARRINDLLMIAKAEDGCLTLVPNALFLEEVMLMAYARVEGLAKLNHVTINMNLESSEGCRIYGTAEWLAQALVTILDNAIKFSPGQAEIGLELQNKGSRAYITISDQGDGVSDEDLEHLFDRFYQTPKGRRKGGSGLGLAVAKWIVVEHGGDIQARNVEDGGILFEIDLPLEEMRESA